MASTSRHVTTTERAREAKRQQAPLQSPLSILKHFVESLVCGNKVAFASIHQLNEAHGNFSVLAAQGVGSDLIASCASSSEEDSTQDALQSQSPLFYDCLNEIEDDLPRDARILKSAGIHTMITLPCIVRGSVTGVLTYGLMAAANAHRSLMLELEALAPQLGVLLLDIQACGPRQRTAATSSRKSTDLWPKEEEELPGSVDGSFVSLLDEVLATRILESCSEASHSRAGTLSELSSSGNSTES